MNKESNSHYYTLGLQPGASPSEIKSAFRRLVKLYHADKDQSLDAEMKYREIQTAYRALLKQSSVSNTATAPNPSKQATQTAEDTAARYRTEPQRQTQRVTWSKEATEEFFFKKSESDEQLTSFNIYLAGFFAAFALTSYWSNLLIPNSQILTSMKIA